MDTNQITGGTLTLSTVNSMMRILNEEVRKDSNLAFDLWLFLQERNIHVPVLSSDELSNLIPATFKYQSSLEQNTRIQHAFEGIASEEHLL